MEEGRSCSGGGGKRRRWMVANLLRSAIALSRTKVSPSAHRTSSYRTSEEFVADRFVGDGEKLLKYVYWSNGRELDDPTVENKQCAGKDLVVLLSRVMVTEFFLGYDTSTVEVGKLFLGSSVTFKLLAKSTSI
uniref:Putative CYP74A51 n=1 Tax=Davidia involucrata TaxID=16924 RepID=A0A5B6ZN13_DAVIN